MFSKSSNDIYKDKKLRVRQTQNFCHVQSSNNILLLESKQEKRQEHEYFNQQLVSALQTVTVFSGKSSHVSCYYVTYNLYL